MIKAKLMVLPQEIYDGKLELLELMNSLEIKEAEIKTWEVIESNKINNEVDAEGKLVYSSDVKRKSELEKRKIENEEYNKMLDEIKSLKNEIEIKKIYIDKLVNEQKNLRAMCLLEGDEIID